MTGLERALGAAVRRELMADSDVLIELERKLDLQEWIRNWLHESETANTIIYREIDFAAVLRAAGLPALQARAMRLAKKHEKGSGDE